MENFIEKLNDYKDFENFVVDRAYTLLRLSNTKAHSSRRPVADIVGFCKLDNNMVFNCQEHGGYMHENEIDEFTENIDIALFLMNDVDFSAFCAGLEKTKEEEAKEKERKEAIRKKNEKLREIRELEDRLNKLKSS